MMLRALPAVFLLCGCTPSYSPDTYASAAVQQASKVEQGVIAGVRRVSVSADGTAGGLTGAAAGGIAGAQAPGGGVRTALVALGGSVVGGLVGAGVERVAGDTTAFEYIVRKPNGEMLSVTQKDPAPLELNQKVLVIAGAQARVVPDYTTQPPASPAAAATTPVHTPPGEAAATQAGPAIGPPPALARSAMSLFSISS